MALQAYPDVPLFRYPYTDLSEAQATAALAAPGRVGPAGKGPLDNNLSGKVLNFTGDGGSKLSWTFGNGNLGFPADRRFNISLVLAGLGDISNFFGFGGTGTVR